MATGVNIVGPPSPLPYPGDDPASYYTLTVDGRALPGIVEFPGLRKGRKLDEKGTPGSEGGSLTDKGRNLADVEVKVKLWKPEHFAAWYPLQQRYFSVDRPLNRRDVVTVVHPVLYLAGITRLYFFETGPLTPDTSVVGMYSISLKAKEFSPKTTIGNGTRKPKPKADFKSLKGAYTSSNLNPEAAQAAAQYREKLLQDAASAVPGMKDNSATQASMEQTYQERFSSKNVSSAGDRFTFRMASP